MNGMMLMLMKCRCNYGSQTPGVLQLNSVQIKLCPVMPPLLYIRRIRCTDGIPTAHACAWENELHTLTLQLSVSKLTHGSQWSILNIPSPEPVQASDLTLRTGTRPGSPPQQV
jgi:hypothetical protein